MNEPPDDGSSAPHPAGTQSGTPDAVHSRKPRIEVLRRVPDAVTPRDLTQRSSETSSAVRDGKISRSSADQKSSIAFDQFQEAETAQWRRSWGPLRSTIFLISAAIVIIAGLLGYTYLSNKHDLAWYTAQNDQESSQDWKPVQYPSADRKSPQTQDSDVSLVAVPTPKAVRLRENITSSAPRRTAPETRGGAITTTSAEPSSVEQEAGEENGDGGATVRAFYSALGAGDGASAAQSVVPGKRQSGPLSAASLSRYYSSFRRPLRVRSVIPVDANTIEVAYDYVLANGQLCRGMSAVDVVQSGGRSLISRIRTRGPC